MERAVPMSRWNKILLFISLACAVLSLILQECMGFAALPIYVSVLWAILVSVTSTWLSFVLLKRTLKASAPFYINPITPWMLKKLENYLKFDLGIDGKNGQVLLEKGANGKSLNLQDESREKRETNDNRSVLSGLKDTQETNKIEEMISNPLTNVNVSKILRDIDAKFIDIWYNELSDDHTFKEGSNELLEKVLSKAAFHIRSIDELRLAHKLADVFLLHLKEYRRAVRRVEKGKALDIEEAYRCTHPGSRSSATIEHILHRLVTVLAGEFLQWELMSSLPCKLLLSVLAKRLLFAVQTVSCPRWIYENVIALLRSSTDPDKEKDEKEKEDNVSETIDKNGLVSKALVDGMASATAAVVPRPLPKTTHHDETAAIDGKSTNDQDEESCSNSRRASLCLDGLTPIGHRGLWADVNVLQVDSEGEEDRISPVYEEPTDFATTIARLRNLLQQKSTATTPLQAEEKSYVVYEGNQFTNLAIPRTEFYTASDGSQQLLYCIQFDDVEQHGVDTFETTTATVRRQYVDFAQLHANLEEMPAFASIMSEIRLPEGGGRLEMENYLKTVCTRLSSESPAQLRHFLRPSSGAGKKADAVAPRLDRFLAKTVTGVFNTLKTVVPGFEMEQDEDVQPLPTLMPLADIPWRFVENTKAISLADELQQLVAERIDYCSVDTAYEAVDSVEGSGDSEMLALWWETVNAPYDEELEELDCRLNMTCATIDLFCEILAGIGSNNTMQQEAVVRWCKLFFGSVTEPVIQNLISQVSKYLSNFSLSSGLQVDNSDEAISEIKDRLAGVLEGKSTANMKRVFGEEDTRNIIKFLLATLEFKKINVDLILQIIDVIASEILASCRQSHVNPLP